MVKWLHSTADNFDGGVSSTRLRSFASKTRPPKFCERPHMRGTVTAKKITSPSSGACCGIKPICLA
eukprot:1135262-Pleurochrysis_carterae.AAC.6